MLELLGYLVKSSAKNCGNLPLGAAHSARLLPCISGSYPSAARSVLMFDILISPPPQHISVNALSRMTAIANMVVSTTFGSPTSCNCLINGDCDSDDFLDDDHHH